MIHVYFTPLTSMHLRKVQSYHPACPWGLQITASLQTFPLPSELDQNETVHTNNDAAIISLLR
jgi:hypothetical protein